MRFRDCDAMGHVNNAVYLTYLEQARFAHWRANGLAGRTLDSAPADGGVPGDIPGVIVARVEIDYRRAARHARRSSRHVGVAAIGRTSFTYEYEIVDATGALIATARTVIVRFDYAAGRPVPISDEIEAGADAESDLSRGLAVRGFAGSSVASGVQAEGCRAVVIYGWRLTQPSGLTAGQPIACDRVEIDTLVKRFT